MSRSLNTCLDLRGGHWSKLIGVAMLAGLAGRSYAIDPNRAISQYLHDHWGPEEGFPGGTVFSMSQTADGYLWIGAQAGLIRFDGWKFRVMPENGGQTESGGVFGVTTDREGNLWVEEPGPKTFRYRDGAVTDIMPGLPYAVITSSSRARDGGLLAAMSDRGIVTYRGGRFEVLVPILKLPRSPVTSLAQTSDGAVWFGTRDAGLFRVAGGTFGPVAGMRDSKVNSLLAGANGELWMGTDQGLAYWNGSALTKIDLGSSPAPEVLALARDRDQNLWVGTDSRGLFRVNKQGVSALHIGSARSVDEAVTAVFEDREGSIWIGWAGGLQRLRDSIFVTYSGPEGFPTDGSSSLYMDAQDRLWLAPAEGGLWWRQGEQFSRVTPKMIGSDVIYSITGGNTGGNGEIWLGRRVSGLTELRVGKNIVAARTYTKRDGLAENNVFSVYQSRDGSVWAGTLSGGVSRLREGRFVTYTAADGLASNTVSFILEDSGGTMWFATPEGLSSLARDRWRTYLADDGLPAPAVNCLFQDSSGVLWAGTAAGLAFKKGSGFQPARQVGEGLHEPVFGIAEDRSGWLWVTTTGHVFRINREHLLSGTTSEVDVRRYGMGDGLPGIEGVARNQSAVTDSSGRIWLSINRGVSVVDPGRLAYRAAPAIVHVESVRADGKTIELGQTARVPAGSTRIALSYTATILSFPERVRFRYRLNGLDRSWSEPVAGLQTSYTNLSPGSYRFRVQATNADGQWDGEEGSIGLEIQPTLGQAWWFRAILAFALCLAVVALYRLRLEHLTRQLRMRFDERLAERTRIAQELHDTLLQGFISASMQLHVLADGMPEDAPARQNLNRIVQLVGRVIEEGRNALRGLRLTESGWEDLGLAFARVADEIGLAEQMKFRIRIEGRTRAWRSLLRDEVYRIGREALVNAFRHSQAKNVEMELEYGPKCFRFLVRDDGRGMEQSILEAGREGHWGLSGMRARTERMGGALHVWSKVMTGTEVEFSVPNRIVFGHENKRLGVGR